MATFIALVDFTQKGIQDFNTTADRAGLFKEMAKKARVTVKKIYWTMGSHDAVVIMEGPNDEAVTAVMLKLGSLGNVRTETLRAFNSSEMKEIISKVPG
ncbi:MAG: GYD domain-containing protein [Planctomycetota bacterium]|jgi:uncharacterized protein with GYD domain